MTEQIQNRKVDELTNKIRLVESELRRLEEDAFKKQEELTITVIGYIYKLFPFVSISIAFACNVYYVEYYQ